MEFGIEPRQELAAGVLPRPLLDALLHVFSRVSEGCMLVGGTALTGFYCGHRRSDDMDLFTRDADSQERAVRAVRSMADLGATMTESQHTSSYFRTGLRWREHSFTADVVLDPQLHQVGASTRLPNGIRVADLKTLLMTKSATLVSRAGEKDLYDLVWILERFPKLTLEDVIESGRVIDGGVTAENILISLLGAEIRPEACDFALDPPLERGEVFRKIESFKRGLVKELRSIARKQPLTPLGELIRHIRSLQ